MASNDGASSSMEDDLGFIGRMAMRKIRKYVVEALVEYDPDDLQKYILTDYDVVENEMPDAAREKISEKGSNYENLFRSYLHPEMVYEWVRDPSWAPKSVRDFHYFLLLNI